MCIHIGRKGLDLREHSAKEGALMCEVGAWLRYKKTAYNLWTVPTTVFPCSITDSKIPLLSMKNSALIQHEPVTADHTENK